MLMKTLTGLFTVLALLAAGFVAPDAAAQAQTRTLQGEPHRAGQARRLALVVGVDAYESVQPLRNAVADAETMASTLNRVGYEVRVVPNPTLRELQDELVALTQRMSGGDEVVLFFSGHGVQMGGLNYLLPKDVRGQSDAQVRNDALALNAVLDDLRERKPRFTLAIVDACRDNPFQSKGRNIGGRGLARVTGAEGQMVIYAAGEGQQALDRLSANDPVRNGLFTRVFAAQMMRPGVPVHDVLRSVRDEVFRLAQGVGHVQVPAIYDQMLGSFYFVPPTAGPAAGPGATPAGGGTRPALAPPPASPGGTQLEDLEREERARRDWAQWQQRMQADFERAAAFQGSADLQVQAWQRFLAAWAQDNPLSRDDEQLRTQAQVRLDQAQRAVQTALAAPAQRPAPIPAPAPAPAPAAAATPPPPGWPRGPIRLLVPFAAGGATDRVARDFSETLTKTLRAPVVVENVPGAGGTLASNRLARTEADGLTFMLHHIGMATSSGLYRNLPYRPIDDFEFVGLINEMPLTLIARPNFPASDLNELRRWLAANRGKATMANSGLGSSSHLCSLLLQDALRIEVTMVPYKGTAPALNDLMGGQADLMCDQSTNTVQQIGAQRVKAYAVTTPTRVNLPGLESLPPLATAGAPGFSLTVWHGLYAPKGTPTGVLDAMNAAVRAAAADSDFMRRSVSIGALLVNDDRATRAGHRRFVQDQTAAWTPVIRAAGQFAD